MYYFTVEIQNRSFSIPISEVAKLFPLDQRIAEEVRNGHSAGHFYYNGQFWRIACLSQCLFGVLTHLKRGTRIIVPRQSQGMVFLCETVLGLVDLPPVTGHIQFVDGRESTVLSLQNHAYQQSSECHG